MELIRGIVQRLIYKNNTDTYCVFLLSDYNDERLVCTAKQEAPKEGDEVEVKGRFVEHKKYGHQFDVQHLERLKPDTVFGARQYLINLEIRGFGEKSIDKVMSYFGMQIVEVLKEDNPTEILEVPGLRKTVKEELYNTLRGEGILVDINKFLESCGISSRWSRKLYTLYGGAAIDVLRDNPFRLMDLDGTITFSMADTMRAALEIAPDDDRRLEAALLAVLNGVTDNGHCCYPVDELIREVFDRLGGYADEIAARIETLLEYGELVSTTYNDIIYIYLPELYGAESGAAYLTQRVMAEGAAFSFDMDSFMKRFEAKEHLKLGDQQKQAISMALENKVSLITGGPGTGKTTIVKALVEAFQQTEQNRIALCAPTGRAAKRLTEATGYEATTIHRLLMPIEGTDSYDFSKNEDDQLEADVIIVDEASMLNVQLYYALMAAVPEFSFVIIVGDVDQLPPIGAGFILRDLLDSEIIPYTRLDTIFRQKEGNRIVDNAHAINNGHMPVLESTGEFTFIPVNTVSDMMKQLVKTYEQELDSVDDELDVQIISPMRRGPAGSHIISQNVQQYLNPFPGDDGEVKINGTKFRVGDKVIQVLNNYDLDVFNGEIGVVYAISKSYVFIRFTDKEVTVPMEDMESIMLAYAITVHKSQGSEYGTVIIPFIPPYANMLQRNLLYTAVTRAKNKVIIIGTQGAIKRAVDTQVGDERYTLFKERLQGLV